MPSVPKIPPGPRDERGVLAARILTAAMNGFSCVLLFRLASLVAGPPEAALAVLVFGLACVPAWLFASAHWLSTLLCLGAAAVRLGAGSEPTAGTTARTGFRVVVAGADRHLHRHPGDHDHLGGDELTSGIVSSAARGAETTPAQHLSPRQRRDR